MSLILIYINKLPYYVNAGTTLLQACQQVGIDIPHFCYHEKLPVAGNCRMCLVEVSGSMKLVASCAAVVTPGIQISTNVLRVKKSREAVLEFLLANHPLDCPICDQGGECDLQDITMVFGSDRGRFYEVEKRSVVDKDLGVFVKTVMNRCIHCTRCVRFAANLLGSSLLGTTGRGVKTEIGTYVEQSFEEELSANVIDLCPVGALTSKPSAFTMRSWEVVGVESIDVMDSFGSAVRLDVAFNKILRILPRLNEKVNSVWITNKARFIYDAFNVQRLLYPQLSVFHLIKDTNICARFMAVSWNYAYELMTNKWLRSSYRKFYCGHFLDLYSCLTVRDFFNFFGFLSPLDCKAVTYDFSFKYLFNLNFSVFEKFTTWCLILWSNIRFEAPLLLLKLRKLLDLNFMVVYVFGLFDIHYLKNVFYLGISIRSFLRFVEGFNPLIYSMTTLSLDILPVVIVGQSFINMLSSSFSVDIIYYLLNQMYKFGTGYSLYYLRFNYLDFWKLVCFIFNYSVRLHLNILNLSYINELMNLKYYFKENFDLRGFFFLFGAEIDNRFLGFPRYNNFVVYQGTHGDLGAINSDLILPTPLYVERESVYLNAFGSIQMAKLAVIEPPLSIKESDFLIAFSEILIDRSYQRELFGNLVYFMQQFNIYYWGFNRKDYKIGHHRLEFLLPVRQVRVWHWDGLSMIFDKVYLFFYYFKFSIDFFDNNSGYINVGKYYNNYQSPSIYMYYRTDILSKFSKTLSLCYNKTLVKGFSFYR